MIELYRFRSEEGDEPFTRWLNGVRDKAAQARVRIRLRNLQAGNFGDCASVGEGVIELRVHVGAGHRVYLGRHGATMAILLGGGDKKSQAADIKRAKDIWTVWKRRQT